MAAPRARVFSRLHGRPASRPPKSGSLRTPTPSWRPDLTLPAVSPVPLLQRVPAVVTIVVLSRLIGAAATVGRCGGGLGESGAGNERGQGQSGDEHFHSTVRLHVTDPRRSNCASAGANRPARLQLCVAFGMRTFRA